MSALPPEAEERHSQRESNQSQHVRLHSHRVVQWTLPVSRRLGKNDALTDSLYDASDEDRPTGRDVDLGRKGEHHRVGEAAGSYFRSGFINAWFSTGPVGRRGKRPDRDKTGRGA